MPKLKKVGEVQMNTTYDVIPLRRMIIAPTMIVPLLIGRSATLSAADHSLKGNHYVICVPQKRDLDNQKNPTASDLYRYGTICNIVQHFPLPDGNMRLLLHGLFRVRIDRFVRVGDQLRATYSLAPMTRIPSSPRGTAYLRNLKNAFENYAKLNKNLPDELLKDFDSLTQLEDCFYFILTYIEQDLKTKERIYEIDNLSESIQALLRILHNEVEIMKLERQIEGKVKQTLSKLQKEYYLTEQLKIIHKELGITKEAEDELIELRKQVEKANLSPEARQHAEEELKKLERLTQHAQDYSVIYGYINWILEIPWDPRKSKDIDLQTAEDILNEDHYGLEKVKERIVEFLAVMKMSQKTTGQILCFVGPPGVGKTSLGKSIARALDRDFIRISLGGVRDEAEIRGHRRTYVAALPGVIMQSMKKAGSTNPLIMMDEIDKMSMDFRGDPSAALLEVLDPEQNFNFRDHFLDFGYDLSHVLFITTANHLGSIPRPLIDRMEILYLPGYTQYEKLNIAKRHLIPKQLEKHEVNGKLDIKFEDMAIEKIISLYTREAGVRELERKISAVIRKIVKNYMKDSKMSKFKIKPQDIEKYLGIPEHLYSDINREDAVGIVTGLAWTSAGGETLQVETVKMKGEGKIKLTGNLGEVMKASAQAAYSFARKHATEYGIEEDFNKKYDLHLHIPEGAIPKDGPSAGVTMVTSIVSVLSDRPVDHNVAMTGEITLSGKVLPIGGLAEKMIAAKRAGITTIIIPEKNRPSLSEIAAEIKEGMNIHFAETIDDVLKIALK
ncbi:MAG TPA: endopeptidase La [Candidatus Cloacimonadota bacterium]|nr:endopeptidase La [Candidatus Cloacimonadota bacterium]